MLIRALQLCIVIAEGAVTRMINIDITAAIF